MEWASSFSLLVLGASALIAQVALIREVSGLFYGNELFVGWALFSWLLWSGIFSLGFGRFLSPGGKAARIFPVAHSLVAILFPASLWFARTGRAWIGLPGLAPDLPSAMLLVFLLLAPLTATFAVLFIAAAKVSANRAAESRWGQRLGLCYMWETLGFVIGGLWFAYDLVHAVPFLTAQRVAWMNVGAAAIRYRPLPHRSLAGRISLALAAACATVLTAATNHLARYTLRMVFPQQDILLYRSSVYGTFAITQLGSQRNFYHSGSLLGSDADEEWNEQRVHLPLLFHSAPRRILMIGGGLTGALSEVLKHQPQQVDYVELDPVFLRAARAFLPEAVNAAFEDSRVTIIPEDGRAYLNRITSFNDGPRYDVILINVSDPTTLFVNRLFTREAFVRARTALRPGGILSTYLTFTPDFFSAEQSALPACVQKTLQQVFPSVLMLPEYAVFFIASPDQTLDSNPAPLLERLAERKPETAFVHAPFIEYRLTTDRNRQVAQLFQRLRIVPNNDRRPIAVFYAIMRWLRMLHPQLASFVAALGIFPAWVILFATALIAIAAAARARASSTGGILLGMAGMSFTLMATEMVILLLFQILYGYLYYRISLIVATMMLGLAAGSWTGTHFASPQRVHLAILHIASGLFILATAGLVFGGSALGERMPGLFQFSLIVGALLAGLLGGLEFSLANRLVFENAPEDHRRAGWVYAADLLGSCAGTLLTSLWFLPVYGVGATLTGLLLLNSGLALAMAIPTRRAPFCK